MFDRDFILMMFLLHFVLYYASHKIHLKQMIILKPIQMLRHNIIGDYNK
jgi:hypothetical protein